MAKEYYPDDLIETVIRKMFGEVEQTLNQIEVDCLLDYIQDLETEILNKSKSEYQVLTRYLAEEE